MLFVGKTKIKESKLQIKLVVTAFIHETFNQYFIIIDSISTTNNSQIITYNTSFHIISGSTNHNKGRVIVVGIIQNKRSFLLEISLFSHHIPSIIPYFLQKNFAIKNKINVSIVTANNQKTGISFILSFISCIVL